MANKNGKSSAGKGNGSVSGSKTDYGVSFVYISLNKEDKEYLQNENFSEQDFCDFIGECVDNGYKTTLSYDSRNDAAICSITGKTCVEENLNRCLTARGATFMDAAQSLRYKLSVYCYDGIFPGHMSQDGVKFG